MNIKFVEDYTLISKKLKITQLLSQEIDKREKKIGKILRL
jgi:hypothetical protein